MTKKEKFYNLIIAVLLIIILFLSTCGKKPIGNQQIIVSKADTSYAVITKNIITYVPKWKKLIVNDTIHDSIPYLTHVDTSNILKDYFNTYVYEDSIKTDTIQFYINDSISQNKIKSRGIKYTLKFPTITKTNTEIINKSRNEFYYGIGLVGSKTGINYFGPELLLRTKNKSVYGVGAGIDGNFTPNLSLRAYWKIGKK